MRSKLTYIDNTDGSRYLDLLSEYLISSIMLNYSDLTLAGKLYNLKQMITITTLCRKPRKVLILNLPVDEDLVNYIKDPTMVSLFGWIPEEIFIFYGVDTVNCNLRN